MYHEKKTSNTSSLNIFIIMIRNQSNMTFQIISHCNLDSYTMIMLGLSSFFQVNISYKNESNHTMTPVNFLLKND